MKSDLITDEQIEAVWYNANFGPISKREVVDNTVLKCAGGYHTGYTAQCIARELKLVTPKQWKLTKLGMKYLYEAFVKDKNF